MKKGPLANIVDYGKFIFSAKTRFQIHSPFLFELINQVLKNILHFEESDQIEAYYKDLRKDKSLFQKEDFGARGMSGVRSISDEVLSSSAKPAKGKILFNLVKYFQCKTILELGTSLGVGTLYLALAQKNFERKQLLTIEGNEALCEITKTKLKNSLHFKDHIDHVTFLLGNFDNVLQKALSDFETLDLIYFDGNHRKEPTLRYFQQCLPKIHNGSIMVFDDIHWSKGMEEAWQQIKESPSISQTIDLYHLGLVFFDRNLTKQDFKLNLLI